MTIFYQQTQIFPMKINSLIIVLLVGMLVLSSACKYENGPILSVTSRENRIANTWEVVAATDASGTADSSSYDNWTYSFAEDGTATLTYTLNILGSPQDINLTGEWNLLDNDQNLQLILEDVTGLININEEYIITRLTNNELWLRDDTDELATLEMAPVL